MWAASTLARKTSGAVAMEEASWVVESTRRVPVSAVSAKAATTGGAATIEMRKNLQAAESVLL